MDIRELQSKLSASRKILITTHHRPDGDAIGSSLGLYNYLLLKKHEVTVVTPNGYPGFLQWMPGNDKVVDFEKDTERARQAVAAADIIFCLDFNEPGRLEGFSGLVMASKAFKVMIDHHLHPDNFCDITYSFPAASSTCELVYELICSFGDEQMINRAIAECIYAGIMTDTASFRFSSMRANTHRIIAHLMECGAVNYRIHEAVYDTFSPDRLRLLGHCIDKMKIFREYNTALITVSAADLERYNYQTGDTEGIVNYPLSVEGIRFSVFFAERERRVKISFRSKGDFSARDFAAKYFNGGGHKNAAGGHSDLSLSEAEALFVSLLPSCKKELNS